MPKPAYIISVASAEDNRLVSSPLGAAWVTKKGNHRMQLTCYSVQPTAIVYLHTNHSQTYLAENHGELAQYLRRRDQDNVVAVHRVFSAKKLKDGGVWFEKHGEIVQPSDSNLLLLRVNTLPYPNPYTSLFFASMNKSCPPNRVGDESTPFSEEVSELNPADYI